MSRVKRGVTARARHKKVLAQAKGFRGRRSTVFRVAKEAVMKAGHTPIVTAVTKNVYSALCGLPVSTLLPVNWVCLTAYS